MKIVIVEDNETIKNELCDFLHKYGYEAEGLDDFDHPVDDILGLSPDLILLDINLPVFDGYYICRELRSRTDVPIIMVTSRDSEMDELMSMNLGADDFITKPYNTQILLAHVASVLNRVYRSGLQERVSDERITLDLSKCIVAAGDKEVELSKNEMRILHELMKHKGNILSRDELMNVLWQSDEFVDDNTLTVNVNRLRRKLEEVGVTAYIQTRRGLGYLV